MDGQLAFDATGGAIFLGLMKDRAAHPERLLDISRLPDMGADQSAAGRGPARRRVGPHERRRSGFGGAPALSRHRREPAFFAGSGQLRYMATIGVNILQRTRCEHVPGRG